MRGNRALGKLRWMASVRMHCIRERSYAEKKLHIST